LTGSILDRALTLFVLPDVLAICRLAADAPIPSWVTRRDFFSITWTRDELSIVCAQRDVPADARCERDWRALRVEGPLDFALTGVLASLAAPLADAGIGIFAISTFDTDYLLVKETNLQHATAVLSQAGHQVR
jgi:uncharacterized protein